ncbi:MAG: tRNA (adenosine(37)-N6)-dimethylallyltransferase MiaA [Panacagrimonas sp.]
MRPVVLLMGPTASGKTGLSLALAEQLRTRGQSVEIVSVDSVQIYRGMDIGTAKPDAAARAAVPHHLIDICDAADPYSAARFCVDARAAIDAIHARGALPLLVGGTMLYFRALTAGLSPLPTADPALRATLAARAGREGWPALHQHLARLDPVTAARLHPNDGQRIQRAIEVIETSGQSLSSLHAQSVEVAPDLRFLKLALMPAERAVLHARIERRLAAMLAQGFIEEVAALRARGDLDPALPSMRAVGYRQIWDHLDGHYDAAEARLRALSATRQFAKRQATWLRSEHDLCWLNPESADVLGATLRQVDAWMTKLPW